jgi:hypothetical protein
MTLRSALFMSKEFPLHVFRSMAYSSSSSCHRVIYVRDRSLQKREKERKKVTLKESYFCRLYFFPSSFLFPLSLSLSLFLSLSLSTVSFFLSLFLSLSLSLSFSLSPLVVFVPRDVGDLSNNSLSLDEEKRRRRSKRRRMIKSGLEGKRESERERDEPILMPEM